MVDIFSNPGKMVATQKRSGIYTLLDDSDEVSVDVRMQTDKIKSCEDQSAQMYRMFLITRNP